MNKSNTKAIVILYYMAALCFFIAAIIGYIEDKSFSTLDLCLGILMLCTGSLRLVKFRKEEKNEDK